MVPGDLGPLADAAAKSGHGLTQNRSELIIQTNFRDVYVPGESSTHDSLFFGVMKYTDEDPYSEEVIPLLEGLGFQLVELTSATRKGTLHVHLTIHRAEGVSLDDCAEVYTTLMPRLEVLSGNRDIHLEVSSPGVNRSIKSGREFGLFEGKGVKLFTLDADDWVGGVIATSDEEAVTLRTKAGERRFVYGTIKKAKLDESQEEE